ncbi:MAG: acriflavin resistance periplasmic protein [uncultured bacterium]|nr:MAG: acriflavin resistance periplasmic protein [uncultured bacterium]
MLWFGLNLVKLDGLKSFWIGMFMLKQITISFIMILGLANLALAKSAETPPVFVETITVQPSPHQAQVSTTGSLISIPGIVVKPEISGRITQIHFKSGDSVPVGAPLIEINTDILKAQLADVQAQLQLTRLQFERFSELYKTHDVSKSDFDKAQADYNSARAKVEDMKAQLRQANIVAPFAGKLGLSQVNLGDYVNAGQNIVNLQSLDPLRVDFSIPELYLSKAAIGQTVLLHTDAYPNETFVGKVEAIESLINQNNRTLNIRASVPNKDGKLLPGGFAEVILQFGSQQQIIKIPQTAVVYTPGSNYVFMVVDGKAVKTPVILGDRDSNNVIIKSGIKVGDVIVTVGQLKIHDGSPVATTGSKN